MAGRYDRISSVVRKEWRHIFRDKVNCLLLFLMPAFLLILLGYALAFEVRHYNIKVCLPPDEAVAERLVEHLARQPKLHVVGFLESSDDIPRAMLRDNTRAVVVCREDLGIDIWLDGSSPLLSMNGEVLILPAVAAFVAEETGITVDRAAPDIQSRYNPDLKREYASLPGLALIAFLLVSCVLLAMSVNKEKVSGTFRQLRLTRLSSLELILGKSLPYLLVALLHTAMVLGACCYFGVPVRGGLVPFCGLCLLYVICCMALGLAAAAWFDRPLDLLIVCWLFIFIPNLMLSGFVFPLATMVPSVRCVAEFLPGTAFLEAFRSIAYKGMGLAENARWLLTLSAEWLLASVLAIIGFTRRIPR